MVVSITSFVSLLVLSFRAWIAVGGGGVSWAMEASERVAAIADLPFVVGLDQHAG